MRLVRYLLTRVGLAAFVLWAAFTLAFFILYLLPSDPAEIMAAGAEGETVDPEALARFRAKQGLDRPLLVQYADALWRALHGDLGTSIASGRPVTEVLANALPPTFLLAGITLLVSILVGVILAIPAVLSRRPRVRDFIRSLPGLGLSIPTFVIGLVLLQVVSFRLGWVPAFGDAGTVSLILPVITLAIPASALITQLLVKGIDQEMTTSYVTTLTARGLSRPRILLGNVLRNACLPALTAAALLVGELFAGSIVVETVFSRPGLGRIAVSSVVARDLPVVLGIVAVGALAFVVVNVVVDLVYPLLDPRIVNARGRRR